MLREIGGTEDGSRYGGILTRREHFINYLRKKEISINDLRDVVHSIHLVDQIEGNFT